MLYEASRSEIVPFAIVLVPICVEQAEFPKMHRIMIQIKQNVIVFFIAKYRRTNPPIPFNLFPAGYNNIQFRKPREQNEKKQRLHPFNIDFGKKRVYLII